MRSEQINLDAYITGFFDGDGSIVIGIYPVGEHFVLQSGICIYQSYLSGLFDAEGHIVCNFNNNQERVDSKVGIDLREGESRILFLLKDYLLTKGIKSGVGIGKRRDINHDILMRLNITGWHNVKRFLELVYPYSFVKKPQIEIMLNEILPRIKPRGRRYSRRQIIDVMHSVDKMSALKGHQKNINKIYNERYFRELWDIWD